MYHRNWKVVFWGQLHSLTHLVSQLLKLLANKLRRNRNRGAFYFSNCYYGPMVCIYQLTSIGRKTICAAFFLIFLKKKSSLSIVISYKTRVDFKTLLLLWSFSVYIIIWGFTAKLSLCTLFFIFFCASWFSCITKIVWKMEYFSVSLDGWSMVNFLGKFLL